jgi:hypothetical protein
VAEAASHLVHWLLYGLLLIVPLLGWIGVSLYPSLTLFDLFDLPRWRRPTRSWRSRARVHGKLDRDGGARGAISRRLCTISSARTASSDAGLR